MLHFIALSPKPQNLVPKLFNSKPKALTSKFLETLNPKPKALLHTSKFLETQAGPGNGNFCKAAMKDYTRPSELPFQLRILGFRVWQMQAV